MKAGELEKAGYTAVQFVGKGMIKAVSLGGNLSIFKEKHGKWVRDIVSNTSEWDKIPHRANQSGQEAFQGWDKWLGRSRQVADRHTSGQARDTDENAGRAEQATKRHGPGIERGFSQPYKAGAQVAYKSLKSIEGNTNESLKELKQKPIKFGLKQMAESEAVGGAGRQRGGPIFVGGKGTGDIVPAMLEPGEVVLNRKAVKALGGAGRANRINKRFPRFQGGGEVGGLDFALGPYTRPADPIRRRTTAGGNSARSRFGLASVLGCRDGAPVHRARAGRSGEHPPFGGVTPRRPCQLRADRPLPRRRIRRKQGPSGDEGNDRAGRRDARGAGVSGAVAEKIARVLIEGPNHVAKNIAQGTTEMVRSAPTSSSSEVRAG